MPGQVVTLASEAPLLEDEYSHNEPGQRRPRKGKAKSKKRRKQGKRKLVSSVNTRSRIAEAMGTSTY